MVAGLEAWHFVRDVQRALADSPTARPESGEAQRHGQRITAHLRLRRRLRVAHRLPASWEELRALVLDVRNTLDAEYARLGEWDRRLEAAEEALEAASYECATERGELAGLGRGTFTGTGRLGALHLLMPADESDSAFDDEEPDLPVEREDDEPDLAGADAGERGAIPEECVPTIK